MRKAQFGRSFELATLQDSAGPMQISRYRRWFAGKGGSEEHIVGPLYFSGPGLPYGGANILNVGNKGACCTSHTAVILNVWQRRKPSACEICEARSRMKRSAINYLHLRIEV